MEQEDPQLKRSVDPSREGSIWTRMRHIERRQWWLWASAIVVTLLLTSGILSFTASLSFMERDASRLFAFSQSARGLLGLVLLFDVYVIYQQLQIYRIRRRLIEQEELFRLISENAADMIAVVDTAGGRVYNSPSYEKVLGYSPAELKLTPAFEQIHPDDRQKVMDAANEAKQSGIGRPLEYRIRHKNGTWRIFESTASAIRNHRGEIEKLVIVNRDITERKQTEEALQRSEMQLRQAQKMEAVGRLSGGVAHDFNNLLSVIIGYSDQLETSLPAQSPLLTSVEEIRKAGHRAATLTRQLLSFSRQQIVERKVLDLNAVVFNLGGMLKRLIGQDIKLVTVLDPALGKVKADQGQLEQVIINLVVNARDAMPHGGRLAIETKNAVLDEFSADHFHDVQPGHYTVLTVSDSGVGMDAETQSHIFEPFFTTKDLGKGTGLGLATVYGIVKQSGGDVSVRSLPGEGATFRIYLPRVDGIVQTAKPEAPSMTSTEGSETILLVEDEESIRKLISDLLAQNGYKILAAKNGTEALEIGRRHSGPVHLLLTDVAMEGMSGPELAKQLSGFRSEARVLFMSGYADRSLSQQSSDLPETFFLQKPFTREGLMRKVRQCLDLTQEKTPA